MTIDDLKELYREIETKMKEIGEEEGDLRNSLQEQIARYHVTLAKFKLPFGHKKLLESILKFCIAPTQNHEKTGKTSKRDENVILPNNNFLVLALKFLGEHFNAVPTDKVALTINGDQFKICCPLCEVECKVAMANGYCRIYNFRRHMISPTWLHQIC